jgi:hypothetical protein
MDRVSIRILDEDLNLVGEVDNYASFFYIRKWHTFNEFEFHISKLLPFIKKEYHIMVNNDPYRAGVIKYINVDEYDSRDVTIKGYCLRYLLTDRLILPIPGQGYDIYNTHVENIMDSLVVKNSINPFNPNRKINELINITPKNRGEILTFQSTYKVLSDELESLSELSGLGTSIKLDAKNKQLVFEVLEGVDRTYDNSENLPYIFSKKFDNVIKQNYTTSNIGYKNMAYVGGQGEDADREIVLIGDELKGKNRKEVFIDARDIKEDSEITLDDRGKVKLSEYPEILAFETDVLAKDYKKMWDLGDIITIKDDELGIVQNQRIIEVKETYENGGMKIEPTFGKPLLTIQKKIKQMVGDSNPGTQSLKSIDGGGFT